MIEIRTSATFDTWLGGLRDRDTRNRIIIRLKRLADGNFGDSKGLGGGLHELRFRFGPGYRVYYLHQGDTVVVLLTGGDKGSQAKDIALARRIAEDWS